MGSNNSNIIKKIVVVLCVLMSMLSLHVYAGGIVGFSNRVALVDSSSDGDSWAVVFHFQPFKGWVCDRDIIDILCAGGWQRDHIRVFVAEEITRANFFGAFSWLDEQETVGDRVLFLYNGPGQTGGFKLYDNEYYVAYPELDDLLDNLESTAITVVLDACHGGAASFHIQGEGRIVITGGTWEEKLSNFMLSNLFLDGLWGLGDYEGDNDGSVSVEEAFAYVLDQWSYPSHPQIWDQFPGDLELIELENDDYLDQKQAFGDRVTDISKTQWVAQSFKPSREKVTRVCLYLRQTSDSQGSLEIALRENLEGDDLQVTSLPPGSCGLLYRWIEVKCDNWTVTPRDTYYIVCRMNPDSPSGASFGWHGSSHDSYGEGMSYLSVGQGDFWGDNLYAQDCVFLIFGDSCVNSPPLQPGRPTGVTSGVQGQPYGYQTVATDPEGDTVCYGWDWDGDFAVDEWTLFYPSGETIETSHVWNVSGAFEIRVKAQDSEGGESDWSDPLTVAMPLSFFEVKYWGCVMDFWRAFTLYCGSINSLFVTGILWRVLIK